MSENGTSYISKYLTPTGSTSSGGTTPTSGSTDLSKYSLSDLRQLWRAGRLDESGWAAELQSRKYTDQQAKDEIAQEKNVGLSTAKATKGQMTAAEAAAVAALKANTPPAPVLSAAQLGAVAGAAPAPGTPIPPPLADDTASRTGVPATGSAGGSGSGSSTGSTKAPAKLPPTPEEAFLQKQQDKVAAQQLAARMQQQAEDQYIAQNNLDNPGSPIQRNPDTGALEQKTADSSGKYEAVTQHIYDPSTGQITPQAPVGWQNKAFDQGNSLDPNNTWWQNASAQTIEDNRRLNAGQLATAIGRDPTAADLLSPPGGTFALGGGDPAYQKNLATLRATGKILPTLTNGPSNGQPGAPTVAGATGQVVDPFGPAGNNPVTLNYGQATPPPVMNQQEQHNYEVTGSINPGPAELGGRTMGEIEQQQAYGTDAVPSNVKAAFMQDMQDGKIQNVDDWFTEHGLKPQQATGGVIMAGMAKHPNIVMGREMAAKGKLPQMRADGGVDDAGVPQYLSDSFRNYVPLNSRSSNSVFDNNASDNPGQPPWDLYATTPGNNFAPGLAGEDFSRLWNGLPTSTGKTWADWYGAPGQSTRHTTYNYAPFANGGMAMAGLGLGGGMGLGNMGGNTGWSGYENGIVPAPFLGNMFSQIGGWMNQNRLTQAGRYNNGETPTNTPTSWAPSPAPHLALGGDTTTSGPMKLVDAATGQTKAITGEAGPEAVVSVPLTRPAAGGLPQMVQGLMGLGGGQPAAPPMAPRQPMMPPGPTPIEMLRQQAKLLRPRVPLKVGG